MTGWIKLQRLAYNDLPLPQYETESAAGVDFAACLTRPCSCVLGTGDRKQFLCCPPSVKGSYRCETTLDYIKSWGASYVRCSRRKRVLEQTWHHDVTWRHHQINLAIMPGETILVPLGFKSEFDRSYAMCIYMRSSVGLIGLTMANGTGIVDPDYRGELKAPIYNRNNRPIVIKHGQRIVQAVLTHFDQAIVKEENVGRTTRGSGGFGSTDRKTRHD